MTLPGEWLHVQSGDCGVTLRDLRDQRDLRRLLDDTSMPASVDVLHRPRFQSRRRSRRRATRARRFRRWTPCAVVFQEREAGRARDRRER